MKLETKEQIIEYLQGQNKYLLEGNATLLTSYYQTVFKKDDVRFVYFGDHLVGDISATSDFNQRLIETNHPSRWHAIAVIEEMSFHDKSFENGVDAKLIPYDQNLWGKDYFVEVNVEEDMEGGSGGAPTVHVVKNFCIYEASKVARYALPFIKNIKHML